MENIDIKTVAKNAHNAFLKTMNLDDSLKNKALEAIAQKLKDCREEIFNSNKNDKKYS